MKRYSGLHNIITLFPILTKPEHIIPILRIKPVSYLIWAFSIGAAGNKRKPAYNAKYELERFIDYSWRLPVTPSFKKYQDFSLQPMPN